MWRSPRFQTSIVVSVAGCALLVIAQRCIHGSVNGVFTSLVFLGTVLVAGIIGGMKSGIAATTLGIIAASLFFSPPYLARVAKDPVELFRLSSFAFLGTVLSAVCHLLQSAWRRIEERQRQLEEEVRERRRAQTAEQTRADELMTTLCSIGDGVITTDAEGRVMFQNPIAEELTGWKTEEAAGRLLSDVFHIVNEGTRQQVENPALKALMTESIVSLANHTILISKNGKEFSIDDSAAPIRNVSGKISGSVLVFRDVSEKKRVEESNARLAAIVESCDDAIISRDLNGIIISWNGGATRLFGYTFEEMIGRSITILIPPDRVDEEPRILECIRRGERIDHYETVRRRKDGTRIDISLTVSPVTDAYGTVIGASKIARDITERKRAESQLLDADRQKNEFLATLAHELRNPLAPLRNSLHVLRLAFSDASVVNRVQEVMERQVNHMARLVDDLLEISRITTGKIELRLAPVEIASVIQTAVETSRPLIDVGQHQFSITLPTEPVMVEGDAVRLSQIVANILNNAAKYTESGGQIWLNVLRDASHVSISVRDTGIGISADVLPHVLEMFTQADRARKHSQDGLGIGLALVKRLAELHQGSVEAKSDGEGQGSEFIIRLPLAPVPPATAILDPVIVPRQTAAPRKILVVDDNPDAASSLEMLLKMLNNDVQVATNGSAALRILETYRPSVVLLDLGMPDMSGYDVVNHIRGMPNLRDVTVIAVTGWGQDEDRRRTREAGFDHHLVKPVEFDALQRLLSISSPTNGLNVSTAEEVRNGATI